MIPNRFWCAKVKSSRKKCLSFLDLEKIEVRFLKTSHFNDFPIAIILKQLAVPLGLK